MIARDILVKADELLTRHHISQRPDIPWKLAADHHGKRVTPTSPRAEYLTIIGAIIRVDPVHNQKTDPDASLNGHVAIDRVNEAAESFGYVLLHHVDVAGVLAVRRVMRKAITLAGDEVAVRRRGRPAGAGHGSSPKGTAA